MGRKTKKPSVEHNNNNEISDPIFIQLIEEYQKSIPNKLAELHRLTDTAYASPTKENVQLLFFALHKLSGSAGTYGYNSVSKICRKWATELHAQIEKKEIDLRPNKYLQKIEKGFYDTKNKQ